MDAIDHLLTRGVDTIYPSREALEKVLRSGKKITLYLGIDPSGDTLHIGHAVALRKLRQFQDLGHKVIFLIADFTGMMGDPTGKKEGRKQLLLEQVHENAKWYKDQASRIIRLSGENAITTRNNSEWLAKLTFEEVIKLASHFTVPQMIERDMFQNRMKRGDDVYLHEFFYPLMQGYDSVAMNVDLEIGGTDQTFNMLAGRKLVSQILHKEKSVLTVPLLTDAKGVKIGKTEGNAIGITDKPADFYGKIMSLGDDAIVPCFTLLTDMPIDEIEAIKKSTENPMKFKKQLAFELTKQFNDEKSAQEAQKEFETRFQKGELFQSDLPHISIGDLTSTLTVANALVVSNIAKSMSDARRLIAEQAVYQNSEPVTSPKTAVKTDDIIKVGRKAVRIKV